MAQTDSRGTMGALMLALFLVVLLVLGFLVAGVPGVVIVGLIATFLFFIVITITSGGR